MACIEKRDYADAQSAPRHDTVVLILYILTKIELRWPNKEEELDELVSF